MQEKGGVTLYSSEWSIMECLWERSPLTIVGVWHAVKGKTGWSKSTVNTLLGRMLKKGLIRYEDGRKAKEYYPCVRRDEVAIAETESLLHRAYKGSVSLMMSAITQKRELSREEIDELYAILRRAEEASNNG